MEFRELRNKLARLRKQLPAPMTAEETTQRRLVAALQASGDRELIRIAQVLYRAAVSGIPVEDLLTADDISKWEEFASLI